MLLAMKVRSMALPLFVALLACKQFGGGDDDDAAPQRAKPAVSAKASAAAVEDGVPPPTNADPLPLAVGQWTKHRFTDGKGGTSELTYSIVAEEAGALWVEMVSEAPGRPQMLIQFLIKIGDRFKPQTAEIQRVKMKLGGKVQELSGPMLATIRQQYGHIVSRIAMPKMENLPQETVTVAAGKFRGCYKQQVHEEILGIKTDATTWHHPAVPLNALVEMKGINDGTHMELLAYGTTGARSRLK